jgi:2-succinyl-6-hydroxy-2,4-cyclohexadiene-1-carboxylate synthase
MKFVFLHGMGGSGADWEEVRELLPGQALALPASGEIETVVAALASQIVDPTETVLCGYYMGGRLAILVADELLRRGKSLRGLALLGAGLGFTDDTSRQERRELDERWARMAELDPEKFWREWYAQPLFSSFRELPESRQSRWLHSRISMDIRALCTQLRKMGPACHPHLEPALQQLKEASISVLYLAGELDKKYLNLGEKLARERGVALAVIPGAGHILPLEAPGEVAERLKTLFSSAQ